MPKTTNLKFKETKQKLKPITKTINPLHGFYAFTIAFLTTNLLNSNIYEAVSKFFLRKEIMQSEKCEEKICQQGKAK